MQQDFSRARLVCFDNDGTLFASHEVANPAIREAFVSYCREQGLEVEAPSDETICRLTGLPGVEFFRRLLPPVLAERAADFRERCLDGEVREVLARGRLYPGARELLLELRAAGKKLALVTNGGHRYVGAVAERVGYASLLDGVYHHGLNGLSSKGEMIRLAVRECVGEVSSARDEVVMVGDRHSDVEGAAEAGVSCVGCAYGYGDPAELAAADAVVPDLAALRGVLLSAGA